MRSIGVLNVLATLGRAATVPPALGDGVEEVEAAAEAEAAAAAAEAAKRAKLALYALLDAPRRYAHMHTRTRTSTHASHS